MRISKMSDQNKINFTESDGKNQPNKPASKQKAASKKILPKAAKKLDNSKVIDMRGSSGILNAGGGSIKDNKASNKFVGAETNNSIWNDGVIDNIKESKTNQDRIREENAAINKMRNGFRQESLDALAEGLSKTDTRKESSIQSASTGSGQSYKRPQRNLSIFDTDLFDKMPNKTAGEKSAEEARKIKPKDESWKKISGPKKLSSTIDSLFENLQDKK